jgi:UDP-N-acetylmuramoylalanine--D-glutamate ligase
MFGIIHLPRLRWKGVAAAKESQITGVVGILGYGVDGRMVGEFLEKQEGVEEVRVFDDSNRLQIAGCRLQRGTSLENVDLLFRSPGFRLTHPLVREAKERKVPITSSTTYFLQNFPGTTVGVTGSNGKTTCSTLIFEMLKAEYGQERVEEGGNDRTPRLDFLDKARNYELETKNSYMVLELSSFQLTDCPESPNVAVVLNLTPNHLDWHASMEEYVEAKRQIVAHQKEGDSAILNPRDPVVRKFAEGLKSSVRWFGKWSTVNCQLSTVHFRSHPDTIHAAVTAARALNVSEENILKVLREFRGVPHRLEFVRELDGVRYYNDSSCTTPESAIVACNAFPEGSVVLLLGGRDKGMDFSKLYEVIERRNVRVVPYGEMAEAFERNIPKSHKLKAKSSFDEIIATARNVAKEGDNIILSPACASFDMFQNAKERGKKFTEIVQRLPTH